MTKFQIGDKVKFLNSIGGGVVTKITNDFIFVRDDTGFDMPMPPNELIRMADQKGVAKVFNQDVPGELSTAEEAKRAAEVESITRLWRHLLSRPPPVNMARPAL